MAIRIVLDTNVFISALLNPLGSPAQVFLLTLFGQEIQLCMSGDIYAEYEEVIRRPRLKRTDEEIERVLSVVREVSLWFKPIEKVRACFDPDDDIFLECAQAAKAHYLITGNMRDFPSSWDATQIVTANQFLDLIG